MREAAQSLARRLGAELELPDSESGPGHSAQALAWAGLLVVLLVWVVTWRRRTSHTERKPHATRPQNGP